MSHITSAFTMADSTYFDNFKGNLIRYWRLTDTVPESDKLFNAFSAILVKYSAVVAGGSVLDSAFLNKASINDIDVYVPNMYIKECITDLRNLFGLHDYMNIRKNSGYCDSFLRKNKIRKIYTISNNKIDSGCISFDVMAVRRCRTVYDVVSNFDLTVCQCLYDGKNIMATHLQHILDRETDIKPDYFALLMKGNNFLRGRIQKYSTKGFKINFPSVEANMFNKRYMPDNSWLRYYSKTNRMNKEDMDNWFNSIVLAVATDNIDYRYYDSLDYNSRPAKNTFHNDDGYETDECSTPEETLFFLNKRGLTLDELSKRFETNITLKKVLCYAIEFKNKIKSGLLELRVEQAKQMDTFQTA